MFGFRPSPCICTRGFYWGEEIIRGDRRQNDNPFRWDKVIWNLPVSMEFDPRNAWVYKLNSKTQRVASDFVTLVDDIRGIGGNYIVCTSALYQIATILNYLGEQNVTRRIREDSHAPGMWTESLMETYDNNTYILVHHRRSGIKERSLLRLSDQCLRQMMITCVHILIIKICREREAFLCI